MACRPPTAGESKCYAIWTIVIGVLGVIGAISYIALLEQIPETEHNKEVIKIRNNYVGFFAVAIVFGVLKLLPGALYLRHEGDNVALSSGCSGCAFKGFNGLFLVFAVLNVIFALLMLFGGNFVGLLYLGVYCFDFYAHLQLLRCTSGTTGGVVTSTYAA